VINFMKGRKIILSFLIIAGLFSALNALAVEWLPLVPCGRTGAPDCTLCHFWKLGSNVLNFLVYGLAIPATILLFVFAGLVFLTSAGNESRIKKAREIFTNTLIGIFIVLVSWLVISTIIKQVANPGTSTGQIIRNWDQFPNCE